MARTFAFAMLSFRVRGLLTVGEEERNAGAAEVVKASSLMQANSQPSPVVKSDSVVLLAAGDLWVLHAINKQCGKWKHANNKYTGISSPEECQAKAVGNGHTFFTYQQGKKRCQTSEHCNNERGGSGWKIYVAPQDSGGCVVNSVTTFTGQDPTQMSWKIIGETIGGEVQHCQGDDYTSAGEQVNADCCLSPGTFLLTNNDDSGNGMNGGYVEIGSHTLFDPWSGFQKEETVRVLQPSSGASTGCVVSSLSTFTGSNPARIRWKVIGKADDGEVLTCEGGDYSVMNDDVGSDCCLRAGAYMLSCMDNSGDGQGWSGGFIEIGGHRLCDSWTGFSTDELVIA